MKSVSLPSPQKMIFLSCLILIIGLMAMDFINPSLPYIMQNLSASQNTTKGLMVTYILTMSVAQLFYGAYSDNYGRRPAIMLAFAIAIIGFILSALSRNITMLYVARLVTAIGMAGSPVISRALIADVCHDDKTMKKAFSYFAMFSQISPALAPFFGGVIQHYTSWRMSFWALVGINLAVLFFLYKIMPESYPGASSKKLFKQQLATYFSLLKMRRFIIFSLLSSLVMTFTLAFYSLSPFIFHIMGFNAMINGLMCIPYAAGLVLGAYLLSTVLYQFDSKKTFVATMVFYLIFCAIMSLILIFYVNLVLVGFFAFVVGAACGVSAALTLSLSMQGFQTDRGAASATQAFIRYFFCGIGLLCCNFIHLTHFYQLALIFLGISATMIVIYYSKQLAGSRDSQSSVSAVS